jgi:hypothetical protein
LGLLSITKNFTEAGIRFVSDGIRHQISRRDWPYLSGIALAAADAGMACASGYRFGIIRNKRRIKVTRDKRAARDYHKRRFKGA